MINIRNLRYAALITMLAALVAVFVGCSKPKEETTSTPAAATAPTKAPASNEEYVAIGISTGVEYWNATKEGLKDVAAELGVKGTFDGPAGQHPEQQASLMDEIIARKPAGILIAPGNPETLKPYINKAIDAGIPVICIDTDAKDSKRIAYFGTSNYEAGCMGARILGKAIRTLKSGSADKAGSPGQYKVVISSRPGQWNLDERERGYRETLKKEFPDIKVVQTIDDETSYSTGQQKASAALSANPDIAGFAGCNAASGVGLAAAVKAASKTGSIAIVAMDGDSGILDRIQDGTITASVAQRQYYMTYVGVKYLYGLVHGKFRAKGDTDPAKAALPEVPPIIDTGTVAVNKDNLATFRTPSQGAKEELATAHPEWVSLLADKAGDTKK